MSRDKLTEGNRLIPLENQKLAALFGSSSAKADKRVSMAKPVDKE